MNGPGNFPECFRDYNSERIHEPLSLCFSAIGSRRGANRQFDRTLPPEECCELRAVSAFNPGARAGKKRTSASLWWLIPGTDR
jgi:hypothetical protein